MSADIVLSDHDRHFLEGGEGKAYRLAMQLVLGAAEAMGAEELVDIDFVHIDACFYSGQAHIDFARFILENGGRFAVPAWTNNGLVDLRRPELRSDVDPEVVAGAKELMRLYEEIGCETVWTCAPYQLPGAGRPKCGSHIAVGESNAVSFYNSVLGARTNKYGDFLEVACGLTGRAPKAGRHTDEGRRATLLITLDQVPEALRDQDIFFHVLGHMIGREAGVHTPAIAGLPRDTGEDRLKAIAAGAAASGGVTLYHAIGVTPEAPDIVTAFGGLEPEARLDVSPEALMAARDSLSTGAREGMVDMVALGTPHFSFTEFGALAALLDGRRVTDGVSLYVSTSRHVAALAAEKGWVETLERAGGKLITDTCTYFSPAVRGCKGRVMTNSAKWAYYAPGMLGVEVVFGSLEDCVETACAGSVRRDSAVWHPNAWGA